MANTLDKKPCFASRRHNILDEEPDFNLKEWSLKARIARENPNSRRFSASNLKSFREDTKSFRSNVTISSTASSPGYTLREEIDPSTYSFTTALKALQAKTVYTWEYLSADGLTLNSKWSEAEKYISNPLSGEVPLECLSAKTLSARSFRSRITMSAPLIYPSQMNNFGANSPINEHDNEPEITSKERKRSTTTRDVGTQSTPWVDFDLNSTSPSPSPAPAPVTPSIQEIRSLKLITEPQSGDSSSPLSIGKLKSQTEVKEVRESREKKEYNGGGERKKHEMKGCRYRCLSLLSMKGLWMRTITRQTDNQNQRTKNTTMPPNFLSHINACSKE